MIAHEPVLRDEAIDNLLVRPGQTVVDATVGLGGHSEAIAARLMHQGRLICIDCDTQSLERARARLNEYQGLCEFVQGNFRYLDVLLKRAHVSAVDGILFDLGVSQLHFNEPNRGFSLRLEGPLDMRLDQGTGESAYDLVNSLSEDELVGVLREFGEEPFSARIARAIVRERAHAPIATTTELAELVRRTVPRRRGYVKIHPATRTFQALRIAVNHELEALDEALRKAVGVLRTGGRLCVIAFHSLEDRIVKNRFKEMASAGIIHIITRKPLQAAREEVLRNPASRSAKLRVAERSIA